MNRGLSAACVLVLAVCACLPVRPSPTAPPLAATRSPSPSPQAADPAGFYRLRLELTTSSDWTTLEVLNPDSILSVRQTGTSGAPAGAEAGMTHLVVIQPLESSQEGEHVGLTVELALDSSAVHSPLGLRLRKGDLGTSRVALAWLYDGEVIPLDSIEHAGVIAGSNGLNPLEFEIDLSALRQASPEAIRPRIAESSRLLWAFYYPWYTLEDWSSPQLADQPLEPYASASVPTVGDHVRQAKAAGIDGFVSSWWGPGSDTDRSLVTLLDAALLQDFLVTIYFETLTEYGPRPPDEIVRWLIYAIDRYGDHPAFARIDGKPVIVIWASGSLPLETWRKILDEVRAQGREAVFLGMGYGLSNLEVFDGLHEYGVFEIGDLETVARLTGRGVRNYQLLGGPSKLWVATVQPGYDERRIPGRPGRVQGRQGGDFYRRTWEAALASDPDWIFITTWNEWWEHTHIEPSQALGEQYLDLTREFAGRWRP